MTTDDAVASSLSISIAFWSSRRLTSDLLETVPLETSTSIILRDAIGSTDTCCASSAVAAFPFGVLIQTQLALFLHLLRS